MNTTSADPRPHRRFLGVFRAFRGLGFRVFRGHIGFRVFRALRGLGFRVFRGYIGLRVFRGLRLLGV